MQPSWALGGTCLTLPAAYWCLQLLLVQSGLCHGSAPGFPCTLGWVGASQRMLLRMFVPSLGVTTALGKGFPLTCGVFKPLPAAALSCPCAPGGPSFLPPSAWSQGPQSSIPNSGQPSQSRVAPLHAGLGKGETSSPALLLPWPVTSLQVWARKLPPSQRNPCTLSGGNYQACCNSPQWAPAVAGSLRPVYVLWELPNLFRMFCSPRGLWGL